MVLGSKGRFYPPSTPSCPSSTFHVCLVTKAAADFAAQHCIDGALEIFFFQKKKAIWVFPKIGVPPNGWFIMENPIKVDDLGVPLFLETPICTKKQLFQPTLGGDFSREFLRGSSVGSFLDKTVARQRVATLCGTFHVTLGEWRWWWCHLQKSIGGWRGWTSLLLVVWI